ncbi:glycerophosphodiester phosphodiesterase family protein [Phytohalomonas tamaricis]|uniref:glycerophosphodiester phosphodiesterase family protein n=1 Tax=Phytohalomonas tamaricis TaxID=2081032 RepID=UPI000D0AFADF|nr:glycerophosphodiester phosphodiesterase family protein [Phytohalomonas tamaricis]
MTLPRLIGHRGFSAHAPENTLSAIDAAARAGINWVELDVQCLGDGTPVIWHDAHVARCSDGGPTLLRDLTIDDARRLDVGSWFDERFTGERILTLDDALDALNARGMGLNLELKLSTGHDPVQLVETVLPRVTSALPPERLLVSSFDGDALDCARKLDNDVRLGILYDDKIPRDWPWDVERLRAFSVHPNWVHLNQERVIELKRAEISLVCYTVNEPDRFAPWWEQGVDAVISDDPTLFFTDSDRTR